MIKEFEFYHGAVFAKLIHGCDVPLSIKSYPSSSNASYVIDDQIGVYIKHSSKRMSPWRFSWQKEHQDEIVEMKKNLKDVFVILVCYEDGVVTLSFSELKVILDEQHEEIEWISVARRPGHEYSIKGSDGSLSHKISRNDLLRKIFESRRSLSEQPTFSD